MPIGTLNGVAWGSLASYKGVAKANIASVNGVVATPPYAPYAAVFDGTNDYMKRTATTVTGLAGSAVTTLSFWMRIDGGDGTSRALFSIYNNTTSLRFLAQLQSNNTIRCRGVAFSGATIIDFVTSATYLAGAAWYHVFIVCDTASDANNKCYINGSSVTWNKTARTSDNIQLVGTNWQFTVGSIYDGSLKHNGALAELWFDDFYLDDPTKFASGGKPIDLGADGSTPREGTKPAFYFSRFGSGDNWRIDSANANSMTVTGALGTTADVIQY